MAELSRKSALDGTGRNSASADGQTRRPRPERPDPQQFLRHLLPEELRKAIAHELYPHLAPDDAEDQFRRNLKGTERRKIGLRDLDVILDMLGIEGEERFFAFLCERRGWRAPEREVGPEAVTREVHELRGVVSKVGDALNEIRERMDRVEEAARGAKR